MIRDTYDREKPHYNTGWRIGEKGVDGDLLVLSSFPLKKIKGKNHRGLVCSGG